MSSKIQINHDEKVASKHRSAKPTVRDPAPVTQHIDPATVSQGASLEPKLLAPRDVFQLQRTIGNQGVQGLLGDSAVSSATETMPAKLAINSPGDESDQEAERVSDQVMTTPVHLAGNVTPPSLQRSMGQPAGQTEATPPRVDQALASPGKPLEPALQQEMEQRFGQDFSRVRVHSGSVPEQSAQDVSARAYTVGNDIVFGAGQFAPGTPGGLRLLAHELTHVVQQSKLGSAPASIQRFAEGEHKVVGDTVTGQRTIFLAPDMPVTYGDVVALGGDLFGDWPTLIQLANKKGITEGTRGEVWYAILVKVRANAEGRPEKDVEAQWLGKVFDKKAKAAVEKRYNALALENIAHFPNPKKGDAARSQAVKGAGPSAIGAGATYRSNHATALTVAAAIGQARHRSPAPSAQDFGTGQGTDDLNDALIVEAFGDHFLTDAFSAGHMQTERSSVQEYWDAKVPNFLQNFQRWLADSITLELRKRGTGRSVDAQWASEEFALPKVEKAVASLPKIGFGHIVSDAIHDYFNKHGAQADVGGRRITLVGDSRLLSKAVPSSPGRRHVTDVGRDTFVAMSAAIKAGIEELFQARELGRQGEDPERVPDKILKAGGGMFAAEKLMPTLAPDATVADPRQKSAVWELKSYEDLFADPRLAEGLGITISQYADLVAESLSGLSAGQRDAVAQVLIRPMKSGAPSVVKLLRAIITHTPLTTDVGFNPKLLKDLRDLRSGVGEGKFH